MNKLQSNLRHRWASVPGVRYPADLPTVTPPPPPPVIRKSTSVNQTSPIPPDQLISTAQAKRILLSATPQHTYHLLCKHNIPHIYGTDNTLYWDRRAVAQLAAARRGKKGWISGKEAAARYLGCSPQTLWKACKAGRLRHYKVGICNYYNENDLRRLSTPRTPSPDTADWPDATAAAAILGCARPTLYRLNKRGLLNRITTHRPCPNGQVKKIHLYNPADLATLKKRNPPAKS